MVRIDLVTTRGGDGGETSLGDGTREPKDSPRIEAIGAVDEANATLGLLKLHCTGEVAGQLARIQNDMFDLGADLCVPETAGRARLRLSEAPVLRLEQEVAAMNANLPPLESFILPGGTPSAAHAHLARTVTRRAERRVVTLASGTTLNPMILLYLNRLSDYLFVLGRVLNNNAADDVLWVPGLGR